MNYAEARRLEDGTGWHFTVRNDDRIWPHACCRTDGPPATEEDVEKYGYQLGEPTLGPPHAPHASKEEAEQCFHEWRLRQAAEWKESTWSNWQGCEICDAPTKKAARFRDLGGSTYVSLCDEHRTMEHVRAYVEEHRTTSGIYS